MAGSILSKIVALLRILKILYWICLLGTIRSLFQIKTVRRLQINWSLLVWQYLRPKLFKFKSKPLRQQKTMFLFNHRSQGDFFCHTIVTQGKSNFLARKAVAFMFGIFSLFELKVIWFFNREGVKIDKFNQWLDKKFAQSPRKSLIVYPQGHRMYHTTSVKKEQLKHGMMKYAYQRKIPLQIIMAFGSENAFNQKDLQVQYGQQIYYKIDDVIYPQDYPQQQQFLQKAKERFVQFFDQTYQQYKNRDSPSSIAQEIEDPLQFIRFKKA